MKQISFPFNQIFEHSSSFTECRLRFLFGLILLKIYIKKYLADKQSPKNNAGRWIIPL